MIYRRPVVILMTHSCIVTNLNCGSLDSSSEACSASMFLVHCKNKVVKITLVSASTVATQCHTVKELSINLVGLLYCI